jgi:hypothetical protein
MSDKTGKGPVTSDSIKFPSPAFYSPRQKEEPAFPSQAIADALQLQESEVAIIIIQKRPTGGFSVSTSKVTLKTPDTRSHLNLGWGRTLKAFMTKKE